MAHAKIENIRRLAEVVKDNWSLCNFTGDCESEVMIAQTIHASITNYERCGEAYSFNAIKPSSVGRQNNTRGFQKLLNRGFIVEGIREGKNVIFLTETCINNIDKHLKKG